MERKRLSCLRQKQDGYFERYFLKEKELHKEIKGHYYTLRNEEKVCDMLLDEFGVVGKHRHIINGHVPG